LKIRSENVISVDQHREEKVQVQHVCGVRSTEFQRGRFTRI